MKNLAIIPARSGSKGLIDKNIKLLNGKELMAYTIEAAQESNIFDEIMVSTDSEKYASVARKYNARVPFLRSEELSSDIASSWDVCKEILREYAEIGKHFDSLSLLQPTSPLRNSDDIVAGYKLLDEKNANAIISVCETERSPLWSNTLPKDLSLVGFLNQSIVNQPRQLLKTYYRINGALYISKTDYLMKTSNIYQSECYACIMPKENSIDIDDEYDFICAEAIMKQHFYFANNKRK